MKPVATKAVVVAPAPAAAPTELRVYGIAVGTYLDEDRANTERARLSDATDLMGRVTAYKDAGTTMYRIVLGNFSDMATAEASATRMMLDNKIKEGRVLLLSKSTIKP